MNTNPKIQESLKLKKKALALLSKAMAKIILKFRLPRNEFINSLDENLVLQAKKQDPEASNVTIAIRTGIDRRYVTKHLKGEMPKSRPDKLVVILGDIQWVARKFYNSNKIPKTGPFKTLQSICEQRASGTLTYNAILEELLKHGNIKDLGDKIELVNIKHNINKNNIDYSNLTALQINRLASTLIYNSNQDHKKNKLIQRTVFSTQINPKNLPHIHLEIKNLIDRYHEEIDQVIISFEDDVEVNTYPQYGISFLEYKTEE